jgi:endonuclease/exonuclease/phosphatase family metal-dependent hydrolase
MTRLLLTALLLVAASCTAYRPPSLASRATGRNVLMVIATWNMEEGKGDLPRFIDDLASGRLTSFPVRDYIILLQEAIDGMGHNVVPVAQSRQLFSAFDPIRTSDHGRGTTGNAMVATRALGDVRPIDLPHERRARRALQATIDIGGVELFTVSAHLENRVSYIGGFGAMLSDRARKRQADALLTAIPNGPGVLGGDFNTWFGATEPALRALLRRFTDTPRERPEPTFDNRLVLDHLLFDLPDNWEAARQVVSDRYGSDHNPVLGVIIDKP